METRSMTTNKNYDDDAFRYNGAVPWSDLNRDVLFLVMMQLVGIDFVSFSGVCKSWRSLALSNNKKFMSSTAPMVMWISDHADTKECYCSLEDSEGRKFKTILPNSFGRKCVGLTCGYLVLYGEKTKDFWLVNPITRHELHIPPLHCYIDLRLFKTILVFSPSINGWVFVVSNTSFSNLWYLVVGKGVWKRVPTSCILDLHVFKGKIYALNYFWHVYELKLTSYPELISLTIKNYRKGHVNPKFISSDENLYVVDDYLYVVDDCSQATLQELDFGEMKWVSSKEKTIGEYAFFLCEFKYDATIKPELWVANPRSTYRRYCFRATNDNSLKARFFVASMWYFPHDCLNVNFLNE